MRVVQINATCGVGSTGKICVAISQSLTERGVENYILHSGRTNGYNLGIACANRKYIRTQAGKSRALGNYGFNSKKETKKIIAALERLQPDVVHLHNIHGHDCHLEMLFQYFQMTKTKLIWTFHDCWSFTGYCTHFSYVKCDKWKIKCENCPQRKQFSWFFDRSSELFERKKTIFSNLDLTIVTPSQWLADLVKQSFLSCYPVKVIHNGIDLEVFKPTPGNFRQRYGIGDKYIVLGVAFDWGVRKGLDVFVELSLRLPKDQYKIVLVGTDENVDKRLPSDILSIHRTQNQQELAEIYTAADVFVNPTREEALGMVNVEALACATPGITFCTGGSTECYDSACGTVVAYNDIDALEMEIQRICTEKPYATEACIMRSQCFDQKTKFKEYIDLYEGIIVGRTEGNRT